MPKKELTKELLLKEAKRFIDELPRVKEAWLYEDNIDDAELDEYATTLFLTRLRKRYTFEPRRTRYDIEFPALLIDLKVTRADTPSVEHRYIDRRQFVYGFNHSFLLFAYEQVDHAKEEKGSLRIEQALLIEKDVTADYRLTKKILRQIEEETTVTELFELMREYDFDDVAGWAVAEEIMRNPPKIGYLSFFTQKHWVLLFERAIQNRGIVPGIERIV